MYIWQICLFILGTAALPVQGGSVDFLSTLREASYAYPLTQSAAREVDAAASEQQAARWQRFPTPSFQSQTPQDRSKYNTINRLAVEQPLFAGGRIDAGIDAADSRYVSGQSRYRQVAQDTAIRLVNTWYDWQRNQARQVVLQDSVDAHRQLKEQIERRAAEGVSPVADRTLAVARLSQTQSELAQAQSATRTAYAQLTQLAGLHLTTFTSTALTSKASEGTSTPPPAEWREMALARDPQLAKLTADLEAAAADIRVKRGQLYPAFSLRYENDLSGPQNGSRVFLQVSAQPGAGLSSVAGIDAAIARREAAFDARRTAALELEQTLDIDFADHASAVDRLEVAKLLRQSTQDVAESYSRQFVTGRKSWLDVLNAVREAVSARLSIIDAQFQLGQTWWRLRLRALGLDSSTGALS